MREQVGVYKRGGVWWYSAGRGVRRSSGSTNIEDAIALRANAIADRVRSRFRSEWKQQVEAQADVSRSWLRRTHASVQKRTKLKRWPTCLTVQELSKLLLASQGRCAITGIPFVLSSQTRHPFSISVDRIDSTLGYCYGNVRLVLLAVNLAMSHWGEPALMTIAKALVGRELVKASHNPSHMDGRTVGNGNGHVPE